MAVADTGGGSAVAVTGTGTGRVGFGPRFQALASGLFGRPAFWVAFVALAFALPIGRALLISLPPPLPMLGTFPEFTLVDEQGEDFGTTQLRGRIWIASVLSPESPLGDELAGKIRKIQHRSHAMGKDFHVVAVTDDPVHDRPENLRRYLAARRGSPRMWSLLTGSESSVSTFLGAFGAESAAGGPRPILLVDRAMRIRARYDAADPGVVERVLRDIGLVANRGG